MLPDTGERYLSTALFEGINDGERSGALSERARHGCAAVRTAARSVPDVARRRAARRARRVRDLGRAERGAQQRDAAVHRPLAAGARGVLAAGHERGLVGADDRARAARIDTERYFVICINSLGSCFGSTGPASIDPATGAPYRLSFPDLRSKTSRAAATKRCARSASRAPTPSSARRSAAWSCSPSPRSFRARRGA